MLEKVEYIPDQAPTASDSDIPLFLRKSPLQLIKQDVTLVLQKLPYLLSVFLPQNRLAPSREFAHIHLVLCHVLLGIATLIAVLAGVVISLAAPGLLGLLFWVVFTLVVVWGPACLFNGDIDLLRDGIVRSDVPGVEEKEGEAWVFINGVMVGSTFLRDNVNLLSKTFQRPITGIHNRTFGFFFDIIECLVQRDLFYATQDTRIAYNHIKKTLLRPDIHKVVLMAHSQGAIIASNILDILFAELHHPEVFSKLEVYTFGSAANHFYNPPVRKGDFDQAGPAKRQIQVFEHYVNEKDFVAQIGILRCFPPSNGEAVVSDAQYYGKVFTRLGAGGHMLNEHYLYSMFGKESGLEDDSHHDHAHSPFLDSVVFERGVNGSEDDNTQSLKTVKELSKLWQYLGGKEPVARRSLIDISED
ncbi:hypothetical protein FA15DRAFT_696226 [Coprinopsis marcescibilis]|uniref:DUF676 domain-containing protein n=1 Tax=Coprinopsis marcescibilis TaxID=230819 RepID=A0A5C3KNI6_COPMA|nr:hypothetical protein FA15DRAFT_696226 [Coprinopsis marcescibilis]